jgi:crotonobetainyl-CoA:carnitine CoA-transferase CaiB-like acyl-CoA transferase
VHHRPLEGIRVLEIGAYISLPYSAAIMASLGADVVKVERPVTGDDFRRGAEAESGYFRQYNSGKKSLSIDLKHPAGVDLIRDLVPRFDVVMENMRPGKLESLGLGAKECQALNPEVVYASVSGFGSGGPLANRPAYDTIGQAYGGLYTILSDEAAAQLSGTPLADLITGITATTGVLAALVGRGKTGHGQQVETSLMEAVSTLTVDALVQYAENGHRDPSRESRHPQAQNFVLRTGSGESIAVHLSSSQKFWRSFTQVLGMPELADDDRFRTYATRNDHYFELVDIAKGVFETHPASHWEQLLTDHDVPYAPVLTMSGFVHHPQTRWLDLLKPEEHGVSLLRPPWRFEGERPDRDEHVPLVGEDTRVVAAEVRGPQQVDELLAAGVLYAPEYK